MNAHLKNTDPALRAYQMHSPASPAIAELRAEAAKIAVYEAGVTARFAADTSSRSALGQAFADDEAANTWLAYRRDHRRAIAGIVFTPAEAWDTFVQVEVGLTPGEFLRTGSSIDALLGVLGIRRMLTDYGRATLSLLLQSAITETVDAVLTSAASR